MGLLKTRWEARHSGHHISVHRNEVTKGFSLEVDGTEVARKGWSFVGVGKIDGTFRSGDRRVPITAELKFSLRKPVCVVLVDGVPVDITQVA